MTALVPRQTRRYGRIPDLHDARDRLMLRAPLRTTPAKVDLTAQGFLGTPFDQGDLGSCTANAIGKAFRHALGLSKLTPYDPSRLFVYYGEREIEGTIGEDAGASIRDGMKVIATLGAPPETAWPYDIPRFTTRPAEAVYTEARHARCLVYTRLRGTVASVVDALARGMPVVCGISVYESFEDASVARTGEMPNPRTGEGLLGGHALLIVGYERTSSRSYRLKWMNSWGTTWGASGFFYSKSSFLKATGAGDFWIAEVAE